MVNSLHGSSSYSVSYNEDGGEKKKSKMAFERVREWNDQLNKFWVTIIKIFID
jgi:hypothetical protein